MREHEQAKLAAVQSEVGAGPVTVARTTDPARPVRLATPYGNIELTEVQARYLSIRLDESLGLW